MKKVKTSDWKIEEIGAGSGWLITKVNCPYCGYENNVKTLDYWNCQNIRKCNCGKKFIIEIEN